MRGQSLSGCYFSTCYHSCSLQQLPTCGMCQAQGPFPQKKHGMWALGVSLSVSTWPLVLCVGGRSPTRETGKTLRLFSTTAVHLCSHHSSNCHPSPHPITKATAYWACRYKEPCVYGQNSNQLTLVETLQQLNPRSPNLTRHASLLQQETRGLAAKTIPGWKALPGWKPQLRYLPLEQAD